MMSKQKSAMFPHESDFPIHVSQCFFNGNIQFCTSHCSDYKIKLFEKIHEKNSFFHAFMKTLMRK